MSADTKRAEKVAVDTEGKWLAAEKKAQALESALNSRARELEASHRINEAQAGEIDAQAAEIEIHRTEVFGLKRTLLTREGEISEERGSTSNLRRELSRVRREFILSTSNRSEQQSALLGGRKKGKHGRRTRPNRGNIGADGASGGWPHSMFDPSPASTVSRLDVAMLRNTRNGGCRTSVSTSEFKASSSAPDLRHDHMTVRHQQDSGRAPPHIHKSSRPGRPDANVGVRADSSTYQTAAIDPSSTLLVSGSLFVGTGLGLKKTCSPPGESAKSMLQRILKNHRDVATEAPPVTEDPSCAARERLSQHSA